VGLDFTILLNSALKFVTLYWQITVFSRRIATEKIAVLRIAIGRGPNFGAECQRPEPPAGFIFGLRAWVGNPRNIGKLIGKEIIFWWQSAELEHGGVSNGVESNPRHFTSKGPLFEMLYLFEE
jgi:hypothetical protein